MHHFAHQAIDGRWHVVYRSPRCGSLHSVGDGCCRASAEREAERLNRKQGQHRDAAQDLAPVAARAQRTASRAEVSA